MELLLRVQLGRRHVELGGVGGGVERRGRRERGPAAALPVHRHAMRHHAGIVVSRSYKYKSLVPVTIFFFNNDTTCFIRVYMYFGFILALFRLFQ